jgi:PPE family protein
MPGDPRWTGPPEAVAATFEVGSPASVISNNLVWVTETAQHELAMGLSLANTSATLDSWQGLGAVASAVAATGLNAGLQTIAGWTAHKITVAQSAVEAFTTARSSVIPSFVSQTNRDERETMDIANPSVLFTFTPAIVERDIEYFGEHWPHNSSVGWAYSSALSALTAALAIPPPLAPMGASPAASASAGAAVSQAAATTGAKNGVALSTQAADAAGKTPSSSASGLTKGLSSVTEPLQSAVSGATQPLAGVFQAPMQAAQSATGMPQSLMQSMGGMFPSAMAQEAAGAGAVAGPVGAAGSLGGGAAGSGGGAGTFPGAGLTSYTRPTSTFEPPTGGRPSGLQSGVLNAAEVRSPTTSAGTGGSAMPMAPAGMAARGGSDNSEKGLVTHARVVVHSDRTESR